MYFSLITPVPGAEREAAMQWAKNPYDDHQWLWRFLTAEPGTVRDFLFRRHNGEGSMPGFYVVSVRKPQTISDAWLVQSRNYDPQLHEGQQLAFELRANPVVTHKVNGKLHRDDVVMYEKKRLLNAHGFKHWADWPDSDEAKPALYDLVQAKCLHWLEQRSEHSGFRLLTHDDHDVHAEKSVRVDGYIKQQAERKGICFSTVNFTGELEITNTLTFRKTLYNGIGHAKGFGCGLLMVRRI